MTPTWVELPTHGDERGLLNVAEAGRHIPFQVERLYWIHSTIKDVARGFHAHLTLRQLLIPVAGSCRLWLDDGKERISVTLNNSGRGVLVEPDVMPRNRAG